MKNPSITRLTLIALCGAHLVLLGWELAAWLGPWPVLGLALAGLMGCAEKERA